MIERKKERKLLACGAIQLKKDSQGERLLLSLLLALVKVYKISKKIPLSFIISDHQLVCALQSLQTASGHGIYQI
jgi:hypothetical protein